MRLLSRVGSSLLPLVLSNLFDTRGQSGSLLNTPIPPGLTLPSILEFERFVSLPRDGARRPSPRACRTPRRGAPRCTALHRQLGVRRPGSGVYPGGPGRGPGQPRAQCTQGPGAYGTLREDPGLGRGPIPGLVLVAATTQLAHPTAAAKAAAYGRANWVPLHSSRPVRKTTGG